MTIKAKDSETIFRAGKSIPYNRGEPRIKKQSNHFDVTVESYDRAEPCELIGIFLLILIGSRYNPNIISRLYNNFLKYKWPTV